MENDILLKVKYEKVLPLLNEKQKRMLLAAEAESMGRGGLLKVSKLSGVSRVTLNVGMQEITLPPIAANSSLMGRIRKEGGGRTVSYTHLRAHETVLDLVCRLLLEKK